MINLGIGSGSRKYLLALGAVSLFILALPAIFLFMRFLPAAIPDFVRRVFWVGLENNVGAWWSGTLLLLAGLHALDGFKRHLDNRVVKLAYAWLVIGILLIGLSLDEVGSLHERVSEFIGRWRGLVPFGIVIVAAVAWASWQMWSDRVERGSASLIALGFLCFAAAAANEYLEQTLEWPAWLRPWRAGVEEGTELVGMLLLVAATVRNSGGVFAGTQTGDAARPTFWATHSMPAWVLLSIVAVSPLFAFLTTRLPHMYRGRPADWFASMLFLLAALATHRSTFSAMNSSRRPEVTAMGLLLLSASIGSVAIHPDLPGYIGPLPFNGRLAVLALLLVGVGATVLAAERPRRLRLGLMWCVLAVLAGVSALMTKTLFITYLATIGIALLAYLLAAPILATTERRSRQN